MLHPEVKGRDYLVQLSVGHTARNIWVTFGHCFNNLLFSICPEMYLVLPLVNLFEIKVRVIKSIFSCIKIWSEELEELNDSLLVRRPSNQLNSSIQWMNEEWFVPTNFLKFYSLKSSLQRNMFVSPWLNILVQV